MNLLIASPVPGRRENGSAAVIHNTARLLRERGHSVTIIFREDLFPGSAPTGRLFDLIFGYRLARYIFRHRSEFSLVNIHAPAGLVYGFLRQFLGFTGLPPYVVTMHGLEARRAHTMRWQARSGNSHREPLRSRLWHLVFRRPLYRFAVTWADGGMILNREAWSYVVIRYGLDPHRFWFVPNGVEDRFFVPREYPVQVSPRLLFVGTSLAQRGLSFLAQAMSSLVDHFPEVSLTLVGTSQSEAVVLSTFPRQLHTRIHVIPFVASAEMPAVYAAHDIFVFPSLMEGTPLALLEAMASGLPVVTTETCGMTEVVQHRVNGLLVQPADSTALTRAIAEFSRSQDLRSSMGRHAKESMRALTWDHVARRVDEILLSMAAPCHPAQDAFSAVEPVSKGLKEP